MSAGATANGIAYNARVQVGAPDRTREYREQLAADAEAAVVAIETKLEGIKSALDVAREEARRLRREAHQGGEQ